MDLLFGFIILGMLLYSGVYILYFLIKIFMPSNTQTKKYTSQSVNSKRQQQRNSSRNVSSEHSQNTGKQTWRSLTTEIKDLMNEMDGESSKKSRTQTHTSPSPAKRNKQAQKQTYRSYEGMGSSEGKGSSEGRGSFEGVGGREGIGSREGTASYEGTEFHPQGHSMRPRNTISSSNKKTNKKTVGKATTIPNLKKNIVNAVIYKEILDKPRSQRPIR